MATRRRGLVKALAAAARKGTSFGAPTELEVELGELVRAHDAVDRDGALRQLRHRSDDERHARGASAHAAREDHQVRRLLSRPRRSVSRAGRVGPDDARRADQSWRHARGGGRYAAGHLQRSRRRCERLCESFPDQIAALIVEPIAGNMGVVLPEPRFLQGLRELCTRYRILLIFDEVISGFRIGTGGAQGWSGVVPDLTCLGKIIGGGLPVGAYGGREDLMRLVAPAGPVYQAGTLSGNPLAMTAGLWSLRRLSKGLYKQLERARRAARRRPRGRRARRWRCAAGERHRIGADAVLHIGHR